MKRVQFNAADRHLLSPPCQEEVTPINEVKQTWNSAFWAAKLTSRLTDMLDYISAFLSATAAHLIHTQLLQGG